MDTSTFSMVGDSIYGMLATFLATGSRDIATNFSRVTKDTVNHRRTFQFEGNSFYIVQQPHGGNFITPGVNLYFGDELAGPIKVKPQRWRLPIFMHVMVPYTDNPLYGEKQAKRLSELLQSAFENSGGAQQVYDFTNSPPLPMDGRYVSWAKSSRGQWRELGDPSAEAFTNRQWTIEARYVR